MLKHRKSGRLWRSQRRKSRSVPKGRTDCPAAIFFPGKCPNLGRDSIWCCRKIGEESSSSVEICRKTPSCKEFWTAATFSRFLIQEEAIRVVKYGHPRTGMPKSPRRRQQPQQPLRRTSAIMLLLMDLSSLLMLLPTIKVFIVGRLC